MCNWASRDSGDPQPDEGFWSGTFGFSSLGVRPSGFNDLGSCV